jgi:dTDP-4-dehydrorhamnose 3,5-epimerase
MKFIETEIKGAFIIELNKIGDERGFFARVWCKNDFEKMNLKADFVQANRSYSRDKGTIRGLHFQIEPHSEVKLMSCTKGKIFDVIVDLRKNSKSYKKWFGVELSEQNRKLLYVPEGCAHAYQTLEDESEVFYPTTNFYNPNAERGIRWDDETFKINWPIKDNLTISEKDKSWPDYMAENNNKS